MNAIAELARGPGYLWRGFRLITQPGLRLFVMLPVAVNVLVIAGMVWLFGNRMDVWLESWLAGLPGWLAWLETVIWWLAVVLALLIFCYLFTLLANLIASPFNGLLSARVERYFTGQDPESGMSVAGEAWDAVAGEVRKWLYYLGRVLILGVLTLILLPIPVIDGLIPVIWFSFGAFMLAMEYLDNPMGNRGMPFPRKLEWLRRRRWLNLGFGSAVTLITAIPLANLVVMPAAVAGATVLWLEAERGRPL